ncbi:MAG: aminotransferase class V-fold PLP-dependent enzyme [Arenicellales bacterium]|nr:aminotransferase class V-fold PLP-dependent enzyme [Arenicellales bacterium]
MTTNSNKTTNVPPNLAALLQQAHEYALDYINSIQDRPVYPNASDIAKLGQFDEPLPERSCEPSELLAALHGIGSPATVAQTGGRYFGFVNGGVQPAALGAKWLADAWDQNPALYVMSPTVSQLEQVCERWLIELFDLPDNTALGLVGGSSISILCGVAAARNELLRRQDWDVNANGLFGAPEIRVVVGEQAHATVFKALSLLGLGKERVELVPADEQGRMLARALPVLDDRSLVITQAGNVNSGAFDPFDEICESAKSANAWVHVDGAFGLWAGGSSSKSHLYTGASKADSWSVDAHKTLNAPYDCGIILCRHRDTLVSAMQATASYIQWSENRDGMLFTPDMSRRARAVELWATLKSLGKNGIATLVEQLCDRAQEFAEKLRLKGFRILNDVVFNQVLVACDHPQLTSATLENIQKSGECWCGGTMWQEQPVIRISVCSWQTTTKDVERTVNTFVESRIRAQAALSKQDAE